MLYKFIGSQVTSIYKDAPNSVLKTIGFMESTFSRGNWCYEIRFESDDFESDLHQMKFTSAIAYRLEHLHRPRIVNRLLANF